MIRVVIADDHPVYRQGLAGLLRVTDDLQVVGEAGDGLAAVDIVREVLPDVIVLDQAMPGIDGITATTRILAERPGSKVLILTMSESDETVFRAMQAGARGFLVKTSDPEAVLAAIRTVASGGTVFSEAFTGRMASWFETLETKARPFAILTPRELGTLQLMARGLDNPTIARQLGVSPKTVRNLVSSVLTKLLVPDRSAAVAKAREAGLR